MPGEHTGEAYTPNAATGSGGRSASEPWTVKRRGVNGPARRRIVLEPKALPAFIDSAPAMISAADVALAAYHLSRYVRGEAEKAA
jgi:hypothetical protein